MPRTVAPAPHVQRTAPPASSYDLRAELEREHNRNLKCGVVLHRQISGATPHVQALVDASVVMAIH